MHPDRKELVEALLCPRMVIISPVNKTNIVQHNHAKQCASTIERHNQTVKREGFR